MKEKTCSKCGNTKPLESFSKDRAKKDGHRPECRKCDAKYRRTDSYRSNHSRYKAQSPEKQKAHRLINKAIKSGELTRPSTCSKCGNNGAIEAHHEDYTKPRDIVWLCRTCHAQRHVEMRAESK